MNIKSAIASQSTTISSKTISSSISLNTVKELVFKVLKVVGYSIVVTGIVYSFYQLAKKYYAGKSCAAQINPKKFTAKIMNHSREEPTREEPIELLRLKFQESTKPISAKPHAAPLPKPSITTQQQSIVDTDSSKDRKPAPSLPKPFVPKENLSDNTPAAPKIAQQMPEPHPKAPNLPLSPLNKCSIPASIPDCVDSITLTQPKETATQTVKKCLAKGTEPQKKVILLYRSGLTSLTSQKYPLRKQPEMTDEELREILAGNQQSATSRTRYRHTQPAIEQAPPPAVATVNKIDFLINFENSKGIELGEGTKLAKEISTQMLSKSHRIQKLQAPTDKPLKVSVSWSAMRTNEKEALLALKISADMESEVLRAAGMVVAFLIDKSGSMEGKKLEQAKEAMKSLVKNATRNYDLVGCMTFDNKLTADIPFTPVVDQSREDITQQMDKIKTDGGTNILPGLLAYDLACKATSNVPKVVIALTDGENNPGLSKEIGMNRSQIQRSLGIQRNDYFIGVGMGLKAEKTLQEFSEAGGNTFVALPENKIGNLNQIFEEACQKATCAVFKPTISLETDSQVKITDIWHDGDHVPQSLKTASKKLFSQMTLGEIINKRSRSLLIRVRVKDEQAPIKINAIVEGNDLLFDTPIKEVSQFEGTIASMQEFDEEVFLKAEAASYRVTIEKILEQFLKLNQDDPKFAEELITLKSSFNYLMHQISAGNAVLQASLARISDRINEAEELCSIVDKLAALDEATRKKELGIEEKKKNEHKQEENQTPTLIIYNNLKNPQQYKKDIYATMLRRIQRSIIVDYDPGHLSARDRLFNQILLDIQQNGLYFPGSSKEAEAFLLSNKEIHKVSNYQVYSRAIEETTELPTTLSSIIAGYAFSIGAVMRTSTINGAVAYSAITTGSDGKQTVVHDLFAIDPRNGHFIVNNSLSIFKEEYESWRDVFKKRMNYV